MPFVNAAGQTVQVQVGTSPTPLPLPNQTEPLAATNVAPPTGAVNAQGQAVQAAAQAGAPTAASNNTAAAFNNTSAAFNLPTSSAAADADGEPLTDIQAAQLPPLPRTLVSPITGGQRSGPITGNNLVAPMSGQADANPAVVVNTPTVLPTVAPVVPRAPSVIDRVQAVAAKASSEIVPPIIPKISIGTTTTTID